MFKAKLNFKFYLVTVAFLGLVILGWHGLYFLLTREILMANGEPMEITTRVVFLILGSLIVLSWTLSFLTVLLQALRGYGFYMDEDGIHNTATAIVFLAFVFVVPIKEIPYSAIVKTVEYRGIATLLLDKSKLRMSSFLNMFAQQEYHFFHTFTKAKTDEVQKAYHRFSTGA
ncbi:MAG: hypothetical protein IKD07_02075 [Clostridia bacterium]|nr:hypothetical protein [Clostridia bacterium]